MISFLFTVGSVCLLGIPNMFVAKIGKNLETYFMECIKNIEIVLYFLRIMVWRKWIAVFSL